MAVPDAVCARPSYGTVYPVTSMSAVAWVTVKLARDVRDVIVGDPGADLIGRDDRVGAAGDARRGEGAQTGRR